MLKKIPVSQLRLGMYLHAIEGSWLAHPFWKSRFVIDDPADLKRLRDSPATECWIDVARGLDVAATPPALDASRATAVSHPALPARRRPRPAPIAAPEPGASEPSAGTQSMAAELQRAAALCSRSREAVTSMFAEARLGKALDAEHCLPLVDDIARSVYRNPGALVSLARLKTRDDYTYMHSVAVCALMVALGRQLGLDDAACREVGLAGLLHDLGKALMPLDILNKPGKLTEEEFAIMRGHPVRGHELLLEGQGAPDAALEVCLHHHERIDGAGYPHGLSGDALTRHARMGAVCDVYDAITSNRPYKSGWDPAEAIARMAAWRGHFDAAVFGAFVKSLGIYPVGSLVRLESGQLAVVTEQNPGALTSPIVKVFFSPRTSMPVMPQTIDLARSGCVDRIVDREPAGRWSFPHLDELWAGDALPGAAR